MELKYNRYLITGGAGFIGSHLVDRLLHAGSEVITLDDFNSFYDKRLKENNIKAHLEYDNFNLIAGDIRNHELVDEIIDTYAPEVIIHLAARAGVRPSLAKPHLYQSTNVYGTLNLLEGARKYNINKFIFGSSSSVYGKNKKVPFSEADALLNPASPYAATKISGEALAQTYAGLYEIPTVSLRFFTVYGPRQRPDLAIRKFSERIINNEKITLFGDGSSARDYTYIDDIVEGILKAVNYEIVEQKNEQLYENFNLGNSSPVKLIDLVRTIEKVFDKKANIEWAGEQPGDVPITYADISKSGKKLGYEPEVPLEKGLEIFKDWFLGDF